MPESKENGLQTRPGVQRETVVAGNPKFVKGRKDQLIQDRITTLELRVKGLPFWKIGDELGVSTVTARNYYLHQIAEVKALGAQETLDHIELEVVRLDYLLDRLSDGIEAGDEKSINSALRISESRRKLLGLDKPMKVAQTDPEGEALPSINDRVTIEELFTRLEKAKVALVALPAPIEAEFIEIEEEATKMRNPSIEDV